MSERCIEDALIGANLKKFREVFQIKRKELAEIFHISEDGVYRIERGETGLSMAFIFMSWLNLNVQSVGQMSI